MGVKELFFKIPWGWGWAWGQAEAAVKSRADRGWGPGEVPSEETKLEATVRGGLSDSIQDVLSLHKTVWGLFKKWIQINEEALHDNRSTPALSFHHRTTWHWTEIHEGEQIHVRKQYTKILTLSTISDDCWKMAKLKTFKKPTIAWGKPE